MRKLAFPLFILALAVFVYGLYGFNGVLLRDYSIYLYGGQRVADGVPPYAGVFDHKGPLAPMIAGLGVEISQIFGWDDVYTVRGVFFATACLAVVGAYLLAKNVFRSERAGLFAALAFLGFYGFAQPASSGPEPKTPMVLFEILCLLFATQKRWFWSGFFGSLAFLVWQLMGFFPFVTFVLAVFRPREERLGATLRAAAGISVPLLAILAYYYYHGALQYLLDGMLVFNTTYLVRGSFNLGPQLAGAAYNIVLPYATMLVPILIGLFVILRLYVRRPYEYRFAPILLTLPGPILWSIRDFQLADDFYVFLPYVAIGFGAFVASWLRRSESPRVPAALLAAVLLAVAVGNTFEAINASAAQKLTGTTVTLPAQRAGAQEIETRYGEDVEIASLGSPQLMVLLNRENPSPYLWLSAGVDRYIEGETPGGFEGWLDDLEASNPDVLTFLAEGQILFSQHLTYEHKRELMDRIKARYHAEKIGPWWVYVKNSLDEGDKA